MDKREFINIYAAYISRLEIASNNDKMDVALFGTIASGQKSNDYHLMHLKSLSLDYSNQINSYVNLVL